MNKQIFVDPKIDVLVFDDDEILLSSNLNQEGDFNLDNWDEWGTK